MKMIGSLKMKSTSQVRLFYTSAANEQWPATWIDRSLLRCYLPSFQELFGGSWLLKDGALLAWRGCAAVFFLVTLLLDGLTSSDGASEL